MIDQLIFTIDDASRVGEARRQASELCRSLGFDGTESGKVALIVTEMASNILKHARGGMMLFRPLRAENRGAVEILSIDGGPGMANVGRCMEDGFSTAGSPGTGLGAIRRLSDEMDIFSEPGKGTVVLSRFFGSSERRADAGPLEVGGVCVPLEGEKESGDSWGVKRSGRKSLILVADGLGHGPSAALASREAVRLFRESGATSPAALLEEIHAGLRSTRGAAVAVAEIDHENRVVRYAGAGNISGRIVAGDVVKQMVSHNGTAGQEIRKIQELAYPWNENSLLIMNSDGLTTQLSLPLRAHLGSRHPALVAAVLFRDHTRGTDDSVVVVARNRRRTGGER